MGKRYMPSRHEGLRVRDAVEQKRPRHYAATDVDTPIVFKSSVDFFDQLNAADKEDELAYRRDAPANRTHRSTAELLSEDVDPEGNTSQRHDSAASVDLSSRSQGQSRSTSKSTSKRLNSSKSAKRPNRTSVDRDFPAMDANVSDGHSEDSSVQDDGEHVTKKARQSKTPARKMSKASSKAIDSVGYLNVVLETMRAAQREATIERYKVAKHIADANLQLQRESIERQEAAQARREAYRREAEERQEAHRRQLDEQREARQRETEAYRRETEAYRRETEARRREADERFYRLLQTMGRGA
ncbi:hypothetical protein BCR37DRAFT_405282 [Protomyces lactucae-debilis]|uniref:Uncharacterized protein n=1 Tax=Protomyces lactucae-debilis TaxID=2754530 RepID=A0A1Y2F554_PROLT|nr:uncharacterized protein BCR37DRAFT_405282 [Protomyces lactucae-debilis]ORY79040.1 hypothetical protein BCR37DRAFT_405282 [Protomyces lactucae-debilis]